jgi:rhodanese-related sulfurtransferase
LCRISLSPDSCVQRTESVFVRWGSSVLLIARFVPGLSVVAQPLAGVVRRPWRSFLLYDCLGLLLWAGSAVVLGVMFSSAVDDVLDTLSRYGVFGAMLVAGAIVLYALYKAAQRQLLIRRLRMDRISVDELRELIEQGKAPVILDVRPSESQAQRGTIPGAVQVSKESIGSLSIRADETAEIVVYCACPNEASAAAIAKLLLVRGFKRVRPLRGGIDAWLAAGLEVSRDAIDRV